MIKTCPIVLCSIELPYAILGLRSQLAEAETRIVGTAILGLREPKICIYNRTYGSIIDTTSTGAVIKICHLVLWLLEYPNCEQPNSQFAVAENSVPGNGNSRFAGTEILNCL